MSVKAASSLCVMITSVITNIRRLVHRAVAEAGFLLEAAPVTASLSS